MVDFSPPSHAGNIGSVFYSSLMPESLIFNYNTFLDRSKPLAKLYVRISQLTMSTKL